MSLEQFLKKHISKENSLVNYTKIGSKDYNVFGNSYLIPDDKVKEFYNVYKKHVFKNKGDAYFTEKQHECSQIHSEAAPLRGPNVIRHLNG